MASTNLFYVFTKTAGENHNDWDVTRYPAQDAAHALERAMKDGYFKDGNPAVVVHEADADLFTMQEDRSFTSTPGAGVVT